MSKEEVKITAHSYTHDGNDIWGCKDSIKNPVYCNEYGESEIAPRSTILSTELDGMGIGGDE